MLEEWIREAYEATGKISKGEIVCTKEVEDVSNIWEELLKDATTESIREKIIKAEDEIAVGKAEMKKLPFQEKVTKMTEVKQLQKEVQALRDQERASEAIVEMHQLEAVHITDLIHPLQQKLETTM